MTEDEADCLCRALDKTGDGHIRLSALELASAPDSTAKTIPADPISPAPLSPHDAPHSDALLAAQRALAAAASSPLGSPAAADPTSTNEVPDEVADPFERFHECSGPAATGDTQPLHLNQPRPYSPPHDVSVGPPARSRPPSAAKKEALRSFGELSARVRAMRTPSDWDGELPLRAGSPLGNRPGSPDLPFSHLLRSGVMDGSRMSIAASSCGRRSSLGGSLGAGESFSSKDVASLPDRLASMLVKNHTRVIDLFRSWDDDESAPGTAQQPRTPSHRHTITHLFRSWDDGESASATQGTWRHSERGVGSVFG